MGENSAYASLWGLVSGLLEAAGLSWQQLLLAWARVLPLVTIVPAFGSRLMPAPARAVFGLCLAGLLVPTVARDVVASGPWFLAFLRELLRGLPVALSSAALIWGAMMAGGLVDDLRGASQQQSNVLPDARTPLATLFGLFATVGFLQLGGVQSAVWALTSESPGGLGLRVVSDIVSALHLAFAVCAPILCVSVVWEIAGALVARAASPAHVQALLAPLRAVVVLGALVVVLPVGTEFLLRAMGARISLPW